MSTQSSIKGISVSLSDCAVILRDNLRQYIELGREDEFSTGLQGLRKAFQEAGNRDISIDDFTDSLSQIIVYIILLEDIVIRKDNKPDIEGIIKASNPLLIKVLNLLSIRDKPQGIELTLSRIRDIVSGFDIPLYSNEFVDKDIDLLVGLYESLLEGTHKALRRETGAYYTPIPVTKYIIESTEIMLRDNFKKDKGLADENIKILDFAAGTGRFIIELMRHQIDCTKGKIEGGILSNIHGFEFSIVPYLVLQISIRLFLYHFSHDAGRDKMMPVIHLTDALDPSTYNSSFTIDKENLLVVLGNPPYSNRMRDSGLWIKGMLSLYKPKTEKKLNLDDYYIKFIRLAHYLIEEAKTGIVGIITNNSFLDGITHRKMRLELLRGFDRIYLLDLHGDIRNPTHQRDENIFDIKQGVCILLMQRVDKANDKEGKVFYHAIYGSRESKLGFLGKNNISTTPWQEIDSKGFDDDLQKTRWKKGISNLRLFIPQNARHIKDYGDFWGITEGFDKYISGIQTKRDKIAVHFNKEGLVAVLQDLLSLKEEDFRGKYQLPPDGRDWRYAFALRDIRELGIKEEYLCEIDYRPFDKRFTFLVDRSRGFVGYPRYELMRYMLSGSNLGIVFHRQAKGGVFSCFVTNAPIDGGFLNEWSYIAPLYLGGQDNAYKDNLTEAFKDYLKEKYKHLPKPEEILGYIYAMLNSRRFVSKYRDLLCIDFPRIPFLEGDVFRSLSSIGLQLIDCHLLKADNPNEITCNGFTNEGVSIDRVYWDNDRLYLAKNVFLYPVISRVYNYKTGNLRLLERWLKVRRGLVLSQSDIERLKAIISAITLSIDIEEEIERVAGEGLNTFCSDKRG